MLAHIFCLVEGKGEVEAVPVLVRRIAARVDPNLALSIAPARIPRNQIVQPKVLESWVQRAAITAPGKSAILLVIDSDDDCPAQLGPALLQRAAQVRSDGSLAVILAKREFEAWFLAAAESLQGHRNLPTSLQAPPNPEKIRGAKEWLSRQMPAGRRYAATRDQPALAAVFDLDLARQRSDSFDKCYREIERLLMALVNPQVPPSGGEGNP